jgi:ABC-type branched-subunit amino acid transport system ATPase component
MLEATAVEVRFGGVIAVNQVSVSVAKQEIVGLVGPNGSGKSSFLNALTGVVPASGSFSVDGDPVKFGQPALARKAGVLRAYQTPQTYTALSYLENVLLPMRPRRWVGATAAIVARRPLIRAERERWSRAGQMLSRVGLGDLANAPSAGLSYGDRRLLEVARALAGEPKVLLLDEPSAGLNERETAQVGAILSELRAEGLTLLVVDHKIEFVSELCDRVVVLALGEVVAQGKPDEVWTDQQVIDAYLGLEDA